MNVPASEDCLPPAAVTEQLQRVLDSAAFVNAPILSRFLRYVVERSLARDGCALKEYTLGLEVFGRGPDFDPRYLQLMNRHHEGALTMVADLFATESAGQEPELFRLASDVDADQRAEIARMTRMLTTLDEGSP